MILALSLFGLVDQAVAIWIARAPTREDYPS